VYGNSGVSLVSTYYQLGVVHEMNRRMDPDTISDSEGYTLLPLNLDIPSLSSFVLIFIFTSFALRE
jgi:hypothetical protein